VRKTEARICAKIGFLFFFDFYAPFALPSPAIPLNEFTERKPLNSFFLSLSLSFFMAIISVSVFTKKLLPPSQNNQNETADWLLLSFIIAIILNYLASLPYL